MEEAEEEQIEGETQEVPVTPAQKQPDAQVAGAPPGTLAPKQDSTTVRIDSSLVPRLPSDFLEPGDVQVSKSMARKRNLSLTTGSSQRSRPGVGWGGVHISADAMGVCASPQTFWTTHPPKRGKS
uniref:Uncharacterized protein n=1 Tax=Eutreptiella gymnastica TaxID=73025 RepID=A0A6U7T4Y0_9EUGL|mmetsp:Transcript_102041/g.176179  ORF Transcript_102041/g.176179 Transcript_102041/m.176179 type:complete len:125 (+) Transcript_102041:646-1020(+)